MGPFLSSRSLQMMFVTAVWFTSVYVLLGYIILCSIFFSSPRSKIPTRSRLFSNKCVVASFEDLLWWMHVLGFSWFILLSSWCWLLRNFHIVYPKWLFCFSSIALYLLIVLHDCFWSDDLFMNSLLIGFLFVTFIYVKMTLDFFFYLRTDEVQFPK